MIRLTYDLVSTRLTTPVFGESTLSLAASHRAKIRLTLLEDNAPRALAADETLTLNLAQAGKTDLTLATVSLTSSDLVSGQSNVYDTELDALNSDIEALLAINGDVRDDLPSAPARLDCAFYGAGQTDPEISAVPLPLLLVATTFAANATVSPASPGGLFRPFAITALTGGLATTLDGIATVRRSVGLCVWTDLSGSVALWRLVAGTDASNPGGGIVRPADYNASTNAKVWKEVL